MFIDIHGYPWISMDILAFEYPWISMDIHAKMTWIWIWIWMGFFSSTASLQILVLKSNQFNRCRYRFPAALKTTFFMILSNSINSVK